MYLQSLSLQYFKNYEKAEASFCEHFNCIVGLNGSGKTNILDAIHYLSMTKSAFNSIDGQNINHEGDYFVINGNVLKKNKQHHIHCSLKKNEKKSFKVDKQEYDRLSFHLGQFPVVLIAPNDDELIRDSNEIRRKYFDSIISQFDKTYLAELIKYNQYLKQRNALLKSFAEKGKVDRLMLESYQGPMMRGSLEIAKKRKAFIDSFLPYFQSNYDNLSDQRESVSIDYKSKVLEQDFEKAFASSTEKDILLQRTNMGIHRDEYQFKIDNYPIKKYGSQGQQKSLLISLKLAQFEFIKQNLGITPILLLDDIFDKLDDGRITKLLEIIGSDQFGQVFITDAREERTMTLLHGKFDPMKTFKVENDELKELS